MPGSRKRWPQWDQKDKEVFSPMPGRHQAWWEKNSKKWKWRQKTRQRRYRYSMKHCFLLLCENVASIFHPIEIFRKQSCFFQLRLLVRQLWIVVGLFLVWKANRRSITNRRCGQLSTEVAFEASYTATLGSNLGTATQFFSLKMPNLLLEHGCDVLNFKWMQFFPFFNPANKKC